MTATAMPANHLGTGARNTLIALALGNFMIGIGAFVVLGLMPTVTRSLGVPDRAGAGLITAYAVAYAMGSPVLIAATGRIPRRTVIAGGMLLGAIGVLGSAIAPDITTMQLTRVISAIGAGLFSPSAAAVAVSLVAPERRGWALSQVFMGFTAAQGIGNATGTWLGVTFGYEVTFLLVGALSAAMAAAIWRVVPQDTPFRATSLIELGRVLVTGRLLVALLFTIAFVTSTYTLITYLALIVEARAHVGGTGLSIVLLIYGSMAFVAAAGAGYVIDRLGSSRYLYCVIAGLLVVVPFITQGPTNAVVLSIVLALWSVLGWSHFTAQQTRLVAADPPRAQLLLALNSSLLYVGIAIGSFLAGRLIDVPDFKGLLAVSESALVIAAVLLFVGDRIIGRSASAHNSGVKV